MSKKEQLEFVENRLDEVYDLLATLAEAHREYKSGCLDEDEYQFVCDRADEANQELVFLHNLRKELTEV